MIWTPGSIGADWRRSVGEQIWERIPKTWLREYDGEARNYLDQLLSRITDGMTQDGSVPIGSCKRDGVIALLHVDPAKVNSRGDRRYGSTNLAVFLKKNPSLDLVPAICGMKSDGVWVLDGHHRMRGYAMAGRKALTFVGQVVPGEGQIKLFCADSGGLAG